MRNFCLLLLFCALSFHFGASAEPATINQYALVIGIDQYEPPTGEAPAASAIRSGWTNLDGCVNDAKSVRELIMTRYGFHSGNIGSLFNKEASRANILKEIESLATKAKKGDVVFIYYAGHGSQVKNSLSKEEDKKDETMVPADSYKGAHDIRDKELARLYNKLLDKGVVLTVIFDSCHSGSSSRGNLAKAPKFRYIDYSDFDAKDAVVPARPEDRGALIIAAAQDFEYAKEQLDDNNLPHGAFTLALLKAMRELPVDVAVKDMFSSIRSVIKFYGNSQEPVLSGNQNRLNQNLFGIPSGSLTDKTLISVIKNLGSRVELQGGYVSGLYPGTKLKVAFKETPLRVEVADVVDANKSIAKATGGNLADLKQGDLLEVEEWVYPANAALRVYIPQDGIAASSLKEYALAYSKVFAGSKVKPVQDPTRSDIKVSHFYEAGKWYNSEAGGETGVIAMRPEAETVKKYIPSANSFFVNFPPSPELIQQFRAAFNGKSNVEIVSNPNDAQYVLAGRLSSNGQGQLEYAFIKNQVNKADSSNVMPLRTDFISAGAGFNDFQKVGEKLVDYATRLAKIRAWLLLESPGGGSSRFPFVLEFEKANKKKFRSGQVKLNETLSIYLAANEEQLDSWDRKKRYIYVFAIDSKGNMGLIYPGTGGSVENKLPVVDDNGNAKSRAFLEQVDIVPPTGTDHYLLLATDEPIVNIDAFDQAGVLTRGSRGAGNLDDLLNVGAATRGPVRTKTTWSLHKVSLKTVQ